MRSSTGSLVIRITAWLLWCATVVQQLAVHSWRGPWFSRNPEFPLIGTVALLTPVAIATVLRWTLYLKTKSDAGRFIIFVVGVILAGMSTMPMSYLEVPFRQILYLVCLLGIIQYLPLSIGKVTWSNNA